MRGRGQGERKGEDRRGKERKGEERRGKAEMACHEITKWAEVVMYVYLLVLIDSECRFAGPLSTLMAFRIQSSCTLCVDGSVGNSLALQLASIFNFTRSSRGLRTKSSDGVGCS
jgi:hypothetical protein